jgi:hypothetical protein
MGYKEHVTPIFRDEDWQPRSQHGAYCLLHAGLLFDPEVGGDIFSGTSLYC